MFSAEGIAHSILRQLTSRCAFVRYRRRGTGFPRFVWPKPTARVAARPGCTGWTSPNPAESCAVMPSIRWMCGWPGPSLNRGGERRGGSGACRANLPRLDGFPARREAGGRGIAAVAGVHQRQSSHYDSGSCQPRGAGAEGAGTAPVGLGVAGTFFESARNLCGSAGRLHGFDIFGNLRPVQFSFALIICVTTTGPSALT